MKLLHCVTISIVMQPHCVRFCIMTQAQNVRLVDKFTAFVDQHLDILYYETNTHNSGISHSVSMPNETDYHYYDKT